MAKKKVFKTSIKRGDLVSTSGVGSVIRTQNGVFGVVGCLADWERTIPLNGSAGQLQLEKERYLSEHEIRDPELEDACKVSRFIEPPSEPDSFGWNPPKPWEVPIFRFPTTEVCSYWQCQRIAYSSPNTAGRIRCAHCKAKKPPFVTQVPVYMVCRAGHLDEVPFAMAIPGECAHSQLRVSFGSNPKAPMVKCEACGESARFEKSIQCTGRRPWIFGGANESCTEKMHIVERTSVNTYFPSTKSAMHVPLDSNIDERVMVWLTRLNLKFLDIDNASHVDELVTEARGFGFDLDPQLLSEHLIEYQRRESRHKSTEEWDFLAARATEFEVLAGSKSYPALSRSRLLQLRPRNIEEYSHRLIGPSALITGITSVDVLTETRALDGFSRLEPKDPSSRDGYRMMWGFDRPNKSWLPAYRLHGEGIFLRLNEKVFARAKEADVDHEIDAPEALGTPGVFAHSLGHMLMRSLARSSGYQLPSIRDRVYQLADGRVGLLVYTAEGDIVGTLGGLVFLSEPGYLESLLDDVLDALHWCGQDPVCIEKTHSASKRVGSACHQCLLLPETSCERFNCDLDRRRLIEFLAP